MDMERLNRVLRRVRNEEVVPESSCAGDRAVLARLIHAEEDACREYEYLRSRCSGRPQVVLTKIWAEEQRHYRDLQAEYMARYGNSIPRTAGKTKRQGGVLSLLGRSREGEFAAASEYLRESRAAGDHRLRLLYEKHGQDEQNHGQMLTNLLQKGMG